MVKLFNQISLSDTFEECKDIYQNDKPKFLELLTEHLDLSSLIPQEFYWAYHKHLSNTSRSTIASWVSSTTILSSFGTTTRSLVL